MSKTEERVLCIPTRRFQQAGAFQGVTMDIGRYLPLLRNQEAIYMPRSQVENDPAYKQLIPYVLIQRTGRVLNYCRTRLAGEQRLASKRSVGIGGHVNLDDTLNEEPWNALLGPECVEFCWYLAGAMREIREELEIVSPVSHTIQAFLNDDSDLVGQVHLGVVHVLTLDEMGGVGSNDPHIELRGFNSFITMRDLDEVPWESWSRLVIEDPDQFRQILDHNKGLKIPVLK